MMTPSDEAPIAGSHTPRLGVRHLMLWTLCSAVYLALVRAIHALQDVPDDYAVIQRASSGVHAVITGAVVTGAIVLGYTRLRSGPPLLGHPGHWLLLVAAALTVVYLPLTLLFALLKSGAGFLIYGVVGLGAVIAYGFALRHTRQVRWRVFFAVLALLGVLRSLAYVGLWFGSFGLWCWDALKWGELLLCGWAVAVSMVDLMSEQRRDWLHWTGVAAYVANTGLTLVWMIGTWLIRR